MGNAIKKGIFLLVFSICYIGALRIVTDYGQGDIINKYGVAITLFYLSIWIMEGFLLGKGFLCGLIMGLISVLFGVFVIVWASTQPDKASLILIPWNTPLNAILNNITVPKWLDVIPLAKQYISVLLLISLGVIGSVIGKQLRKSRTVATEEVTEQKPQEIKPETIMPMKSINEEYLEFLGLTESEDEDEDEYIIPDKYENSKV